MRNQVVVLHWTVSCPKAFWRFCLAASVILPSEFMSFHCKSCSLIKYCQSEKTSTYHQYDSSRVLNSTVVTFLAREFPPVWFFTSVKFHSFYSPRSRISTSVNLCYKVSGSRFTWAVFSFVSCDIPPTMCTALVWMFAAQIFDKLDLNNFSSKLTWLGIAMRADQTQSTTFLWTKT